MELRPSNDIEELIIKYLREELSADERIRLEAWRQESAGNEALFAELTDDALLTKEFRVFQSTDKLSGKARLQSKIARLEKPGPVWRNFYRAAAAAVLLIIGGYFMYSFLFRPEKKNAIELPADIAAPSSNNAVLTLSNGKKMVLDSLQSGLIATQGEVTLVKEEDGQIAYQINGAQGSVAAFNTLENPRGSKIINITLADGTRIWLNTESSLSYPTFFSGKERRVQITGEAYFEVAHNPTQPFIVQKGHTAVTVLGTKFNINAYEEEPDLKITLLEGKVAVRHKERSAYLSPGQQAAISQGEDKINVSDDINTDDVVAWINGQFVLDGTGLTSLMNQISRWYNVKVVYKTNIVNKAFGGSLDRNVPLSRMLDALKENDVKCSLEGRTITIGD